MQVTVKGIVTGNVQGVGFRYFVQQQAHHQQVTGYAKNLSNGDVEVLLQGAVSHVEKVVEKLYDGPPTSEVQSVNCEQITGAQKLGDFQVL